MRLIQSDAIELSPWADVDDHAPLITDDRGRLPAFDQFDELANGQTVRTPTRIALKPSLFRRLDKGIRRAGLKWLQRNLRGQLAATQRDLDEAAQQAIAHAALHRSNPHLQALRQGLRYERDTLELRLKHVGLELAQLEAAS